MKTTYAVALLAALGAMAIAGCGGGSSSDAGSASAAEGAALTGADVSGLGTVLVDSEGITVYEFAKDKGTSSSCYGACEEAWPPVVASGKPVAGEGAMTTQLGTAKRRDGTMQLTYAGHPLYTFVEDEAPGEANGNESEAFGGKWSALDESGAAVEGTATGGSEEAEGASGGYGY